MKVRHVITMFLACALVFSGAFTADALRTDHIGVKEDPLVRMPGSQPQPEGNIALESTTRCLNCHGGYNSAVEPAFNWKGSMMAQAARDFLFWSCMTVAAQDSIWAVGRPNATDICIRCHSPKGWIEGRSDPTNASALTGGDFDGLVCDFCHNKFDPFFEDTYAGTREGSDWIGYWDEANNTGPNSFVQQMADATVAADRTASEAILLFNGGPFYGADNRPLSGLYTENASGQYFLSGTRDKRASFADADARHPILYSRYHKSKYFCATCHDVSNPILANHALGGVGVLETQADYLGTTNTLWTEDNPAFSYFHVERTFSEFMLSAYGQQGGAATNPEFQAQGAPDITWAAKCQDCHMRDVTGQGCSQNSGVFRPDDSIEHPNSGQPLHDLTGGNAWVSYVLASTIPGSPNYDATNDGILNQGPEVLTLDLTQGNGFDDPNAILAGVDRAKQQLRLAATIKDLAYDSVTGDLSFKVQNNSGHKLISGFPEGRRMFVNIVAKDSQGAILSEINPYDYAAGTLKGLLQYNYDGQGLLPDPAPLGADEAYVDELVYETHPSSSLTGEKESFHFALATDRYKDNRIPPQGFDTSKMYERISQPKWHGPNTPDGVPCTGADTSAYDCDNYFTDLEYAGGYDAVSITIAPNAATVDVTVYYQTTSREYIEFLRDEINGTYECELNPGTSCTKDADCPPGDTCLSTLPSPTNVNEAEAYVIQDPNETFFTQLRAWGHAIWDLWTHNMNVDGAAPFMMTQASVGGAVCNAPIPTLDSAVPGDQQITVSWSDEHSTDGNVTGYNVYYDQAGKAQLITGVGLQTMYTDTGLTNGQEYCYKVTSLYADCESGFSNIVCATPAGQVFAGVDQLTTGKYTGKGKTQTFTETTLFVQGDEVVIRAHVIDAGTGAHVPDATVQITISGPSSAVVTSNPSDAAGIAEAMWRTSGPNKKGQGGTPTGLYTATVTGLEHITYGWDGVMTNTTFTLDPQ